MELYFIIALSPCITLSWGHVPIPQPYFTNHAVDLELTENNTVWLPCDVENLGDNVVRWWRGDTLLADTSDHSHLRPPRMRMWQNNTLEISHLHRDDSGEYSCQVVRKEPWNALHLSHTITVLYAPTIFPEPKSGLVNVRLGETIEMACLAKGAPTPKVTWRSQDKEIDNGHEKPYVLILKAISPKIAMIYTCTADNGIASPSTAEFHVHVLYKPIVIADASWQHAAPGLHAELTCGISAEPPAQVEWFFNGDLIETSFSQRVAPYVQGHQHTLYFRNITAEDLGEYRCRATNSEGTSEAVVELSGLARPAVFKRDIPRFNDSVQLIWEVDSYSTIIDYMLKFRQVPAPDDSEWISIVVPADGQSSGPIHTKSYNLYGLQVASTYEAVVVSRNKYGLSSPSYPFLFATLGAESTLNGSDEDSKEDRIDVSSEIENELKQENINENDILREAIVFGRNRCSKGSSVTLILYLIICLLRWAAT